MFQMATIAGVVIIAVLLVTGTVMSQDNITEHEVVNGTVMSQDNITEHEVVNGRGTLGGRSFPLRGPGVSSP